jgi:hypothetical protein
MNANSLVAGERMVNAAPLDMEPLWPKTWVELTEPEKIEDLRKDVEKIFNILNALIADVRSNHARTNELNTRA